MVDASSFDIEASTSGNWAYSLHLLGGGRCHLLLLSEAPHVQVDAPVIVVLGEFGGSSYDSSLFPLYADHVALHVWDRKINVYVFM